MHRPHNVSGSATFCLHCIQQAPTSDGVAMAVKRDAAPPTEAIGLAQVVRSWSKESQSHGTQPIATRVFNRQTGDAARGLLIYAAASDHEPGLQLRQSRNSTRCR